jgi:hypothetical protein
MANWFVHLNKNKDILKNFYEFKHQTGSVRNNQSGDSGMGADFMNASLLSAASSLLSNNNIASLAALKPSKSSDVMITSLSNVSIFESEEYFSYFHKLVEQFSYIDFNLKLFKDNDKVIAPASSTAPDSTAASSPSPHLLQQQFRYQEEAESQMNHLLENHLRSNSYSSQALSSNASNKASRRGSGTTSKKPGDASVNYSSKGLATKSSHNVSSGSAPNNNSSSQGGGSSGSNGGFNLKSISKKLNIKSWFSGHSNHSLSSKPPIGSSKTTSNISSLLKHKGNHSSAAINNNAPANYSSVNVNANSDRIGMVGCGVGTLVNNSNGNGSVNNLMKHSLSESNINQHLK